jgi:hypothetical protein
MGLVTRRQLIQDSFALAMFGCTGVILTACGQPNPGPGAGRAPAPGTPEKAPTAGPDTQETPIPVPFPGVTATTGYPTPEPRPPLNTAVPYLPQAFPTPGPEAPYNLRASGHHLPNTMIETGFSTLVVIGSVSRVFPAQWSTVDGKRPANPHISPPQYTIYRPVEVETEQTLKGAEVRQLHLLTYGGEVGEDSVRQESNMENEFFVGERALLFLIEPIGYLPRAWNGNQLWQILQHYTITADLVI